MLCDEAIEGLAIVPDGVYVDGTFGRGGHSSVILSKLNSEGRLIVIDRDLQAIECAKQRFGDDPRVTICHASFLELTDCIGKSGYSGKIDGMLFDLGVSSPQLDDASRGFGFSKDGPLDMRMDRSSGLSASEWLAHASEEEIVRVLKKYGEERFATRIARGVLAHMAEHGPIATTAELVDLVVEAIPVKEKNKHPATRTFQAIRIEINGELDQVKSALEQALELLKPGGRLAVISFHSLEDRIVKRFIKEQEKGDKFPAKMPVLTADLNQRMKRVGKQIKAGKDELERNRRARSAVLRIAEKIV